MTFSGHTARKRFGQHWLRDESVLDEIVCAANLKPHDRVLEVGPGRGALTERLLASQASAVHAIELDRDLVQGLKHRFSQKNGFTLQEGDVLSVPLDPPDGIPSNKVVANIPYNITGPLLHRLIGRLGEPIANKYELLVLLLQKEVADRILAKPGQSSFSAMSVRIQLLAKCRSVCLVPPSCFQPKPKVYSKVVAIEPRKNEGLLEPSIAKLVEVFLNQAFRSRRKMLRNSLGGLIPIERLEPITKEIGFDLSQRPQEVTPMGWVEMAEKIMTCRDEAVKNDERF